LQAALQILNLGFDCRLGIVRNLIAIDLHGNLKRLKFHIAKTPSLPAC
jgi:hypothetical protein